VLQCIVCGCKSLGLGHLVIIYDRQTVQALIQTKGPFVPKALTVPHAVQAVHRKPARWPKMPDIERRLDGRLTVLILAVLAILQGTFPMHS
jgi:hypothetical protein